MEEQIKENKENYITLFEAAKLCSYSEPYLRLRARQGKLKSIKLGKKWMTTAVWLADYEKRVREWKAAAEARKVVPTAVLVSAPAELSGNLADGSTSAAVSVPEVTVLNEIDDAKSPVLPALPVSKKVEQELAQTDDMQLLPSKMPIARFAGGQVLPVPRQSEEAEVDGGKHFVWFGALISGVVSAVILAVAVASGGSSSGDLAAAAQKFAQANASLGVSGEESGFNGEVDSAENVAVYCKNTAAEIGEQFSSDRLKEFVKKAAQALEDFELPVW